MSDKHIVSSADIHRFAPMPVFVAAMGAMFIICIADILTPSEIRLHALYIFPLAVIGYNCPNRWMTISGFMVAISAQVITFSVWHQTRSAFITDIIVTLATLCLTTALSFRLRENHLAISELADTDELTGISNRRRFQSVLDSEISRQARYGGVFSIISIDLNNFKDLNDSKGHQVGDQALILLANILRANTRQSDIVARLGGDEFSIFLPQTAEEAGIEFSHQLAKKIEYEMEAQGYRITASIGTATFNQAPISTSAALHVADRAMYREKAAYKDFKKQCSMTLQK